MKCAVGPVPEPAAPPDHQEPAEAVLEVPADISEQADSAAAVIDDPDLRELVARAARASLLKARSDR
jgi:hypothetical protein